MWFGAYKHDLLFHSYVNIIHEKMTLALTLTLCIDVIVGYCCLNIIHLLLHRKQFIKISNKSFLE